MPPPPGDKGMPPVDRSRSHREVPGALLNFLSQDGGRKGKRDTEAYEGGTVLSIYLKRCRPTGGISRCFGRPEPCPPGCRGAFNVWE